MRISIKKVCIRGEPRWKVDLKSFGSKRSRRFFRTKEEAKAEVANLKQQSRQCGDSWALLGGREKMEILAAVRLASEHGFKLREAVETCIQTVGQGRNTTSGEAFARFLAEKEKMRLSPRSIRALRSNVGRFVRSREDVPVSRIRREDVVEWLHRPEWNPRTYNSYNMLFSHYRKLVPEEEAEEFWDELAPTLIIPRLFEVKSSPMVESQM